MPTRPAHSAGSEEPVDAAVVAKIRDEGILRSEVMTLASMMTDVFGPRYPNSPSYDRAALWARDKFEEYGLANAALEPWGEFGYGWENVYTSIHMLAPGYQPVIGHPVPGTRGTPCPEGPDGPDGPDGFDRKVSGKVVWIDTTLLLDEADLEPYRGQLDGKIVLTMPERHLEPNFVAHAVRLSDEEFTEMARLESRPPDDDETRGGSAGGGPSAAIRQPLSDARLAAFFDQERAAVLISPGQSNVGPMDKGLVVVTGEGLLPLSGPLSMPRLVVAAEHYNRMLRVLSAGIDVEMEVEIHNELHDDHPIDNNVIAELPGSDLANEVVMIGGHFDSHAAGTGATDNAAGSAIVMEAMRILAAAGVKPRRTIRAALWGAEEVGHHGSRGYVRAHFGDPDTGDAATAPRLPEHDNLYVYFNVDWYGRFRGIYLQGNDEARPIFEAWMKPLDDLGMSWIVPGNTGGTDHLSFLKVGLPAFQFIQDDLEFFNVSFHSNMDVYDRLVAEDLMQGAVVLASFAYHAAMRDGEFPYADGINNGRRWHK